MPHGWPQAHLVSQVVDKCPECDEGHLDLFQDGFAKIGSISAGEIATSVSNHPILTAHLVLFEAPLFVSKRISRPSIS